MGFLEAKRLAAKRRTFRFFEALKTWSGKKDFLRPHGLPKPVRPWEVQRVSDIGTFLKRRTRPVETGDLKRHFKILYSFGRDHKKMNELKTFARISPDALQKFFLKELGIRICRHSACDAEIAKALKSERLVSWGHGTNRWEILSNIMKKRAKANILSRSEFTRLFRACGRSQCEAFKRIADHMYAANFRNVSRLAGRLGFRLEAEPEAPAFKASPELKALLSEVVRESDIALDTDQNVRIIARQLLGILSEPANMRLLGRIQKNVPEENLRSWLGIPKQGLPKEAALVQPPKRKRADKGLWNRRGREKRAFRERLAEEGF